MPSDYQPVDKTELLAPLILSVSVPRLASYVSLIFSLILLSFSSTFVEWEATGTCKQDVLDNNSTHIKSATASPPPSPTPSATAPTPTELTSSLLSAVELTPIPQIIFQKWRTNNKNNISEISERVDWYNTWSKKNPGFVQILFDDNDAARFVTSEYPGDITKAYFKLQLTVERSDLLRYLFLFKFGGYYNDMDTRCLKPIKSWYPNPPSPSHDFEPTGFSIQQWSFASTPGHPILHLLINKIVTTVLASPVEKLKVVEDTVVLTGPVVFTKIVDEYMKSQGGDHAKYSAMHFGYYQVGDVLLFGLTSFAPFGPGAGGDKHEDAKLVHMFSGFKPGGWRNNGDAGIAKEAMPTDVRMRRRYLSEKYEHHS
ncbi:nucleotide-diphospho-sugar transferase [Cladochytrium replicatum]|nr:nucleotide-diphospho-sugar transferase [Cladochytrium replicatum]